MANYYRGWIIVGRHAYKIYPPARESNGGPVVVELIADYEHEIKETVDKYIGWK